MQRRLSRLRRGDPSPLARRRVKRDDGRPSLHGSTSGLPSGRNRHRVEGESQASAVSSSSSRAAGHSAQSRRGSPSHARERFVCDSRPPTPAVRAALRSVVIVHARALPARPEPTACRGACATSPCRAAANRGEIADCERAPKYISSITCPPCGNSSSAARTRRSPAAADLFAAPVPPDPRGLHLARRHPPPSPLPSSRRTRPPLRGAWPFPMSHERPNRGPLVVGTGVPPHPRKASCTDLLAGSLSRHPPSEPMPFGAYRRKRRRKASSSRHPPVAGAPGRRPRTCRSSGRPPSEAPPVRRA